MQLQVKSEEWEAPPKKVRGPQLYHSLSHPVLLSSLLLSLLKLSHSCTLFVGGFLLLDLEPLRVWPCLPSPVCWVPRAQSRVTTWRSSVSA